MNTHATLPLFNDHNLAAIQVAFAPTGTLRASINTGNPVLAKLDQHGKPYGVSIDLAHALAQQLQLPLELTVFDGAAKCVAALENNAVDIGFFAIDPARATHIHFTAAYLHIEGAYAVPEHANITDNAQVDSPNHRVVVGKGSAYDLFLSRHLLHAQIVRAPSAPEVVSLCVSQGYEIAAGVRQQLEKDLKQYPQLRILPGRFMVIQQAMGIAKNRASLAHDTLNTFVQHSVNSGLVLQLLQKHNIDGASVATLIETASK